MYMYVHIKGTFVYIADDISDEQKAEVECHASELSQFWGQFTPY